MRNGVTPASEAALTIIQAIHTKLSTAKNSSYKHVFRWMHFSRLLFGSLFAK